jgi:hypothetical protein
MTNDRTHQGEPGSYGNPLTGYAILVDSQLDLAG